MLMTKCVIFTYLLTNAISTPNVNKNIPIDTGLNVLELIIKYGYPLERHVNVTTEDGYLLELHRIPNGKTNQKKLGPVLLMHGLFSSSADWCNGGAKGSLAYLLSDAGYDVWLGNSRGNTWSRKHRSLDPDADQSEYWNFSWHEIGIYDLPAIIDHILKMTGEKKLQYVGHSQGTCAFWVMASMKPEYNKKIKLMTALAPIAFMKHIKNPFVKFIAQYEREFQTEHYYELLQKPQLLKFLGREICHDGSNLQDICSTFIFLISGFDPEQMNATLIPVFSTNAPAGASIKQILHFFQSIQSDYFRQYDYHSNEMNLKHYGELTPPDYDLTKINAPIAVYYAQNDWLSSMEDVDKLTGFLPNIVVKHLIDFKKFNHIDFIWSIDVVELLYAHVLEMMQTF